MEEQQQLSFKQGDCWADMSPLMACVESNPKLAFLSQFLTVVFTRGDLDYMLSVVHDLLLSLIQCKRFEEAAAVTELELRLRQTAVAERKRLEAQAQGVKQEVNLNVEGKMDVGNLSADRVVEAHHNQNVNIDKH